MYVHDSIKMDDIVIIETYNQTIFQGFTHLPWNLIYWKLVDGSVCRCKWMEMSKLCKHAEYTSIWVQCTLHHNCLKLDALMFIMIMYATPKTILKLSDQLQEIEINLHTQSFNSTLTTTLPNIKICIQFYFMTLPFSL